MRSLPSAFVTELERTSADGPAKLVTLVEIRTATPIRRALWSTDVTWSGDTYYADTGAHSEVTEDTEGSRGGMTLSFQNVRNPETDAVRPWSTLIGTDGTDLNGYEVRIRKVATATIADTDAQVPYLRWYVSGGTVDRQWARIKLSSPHDAFAFAAPGPSLVSRSCRWNFKQGPCSSADGRDSCGKTMQECLARFPEGGPLAFGPSFPFVTSTIRRAF